MFDSVQLVVILLTKTTAAQNEDALSYYRVRGLYFQAVVFVATKLLRKLQPHFIISLFNRIMLPPCLTSLCYLSF